jgi:hypothetical protein
VFDGRSLGEPATAKSVTSAQTGPVADQTQKLTSFECSKGLQHAHDQRTAPDIPEWAPG